MAINYKKFDVVFQSIDNHLSRQVDIMEQMLSIKIDEIERIKQESAYDSLDEPVNTPGPYPVPSGGRDGDDDWEVEPTQEQKESLLGNIIPGIGLGLGAGLPLLLTRAIGKLPMLGLAGVSLALKEPIGDFLESFISTGLDQLDPDSVMLSGDAKAALTDSFSSTIFWGGIGKVIGGKLGLGIAMGGIIYDSLYNYIENNDTELSNFIEKNIDIESFAVGAAILGPFLATALAAGATSAITTAKAKGLISKKVAAGFVTRLGIPALLFTFGDDIGDAISSYFDDKEEAKKNANMIIQAAGIGSLFGIKGALVGVMVGAAASLGGALLDYIHELDDKADAAFKKRVAEKLNEADRLMEEGDNKAASDAMMSAAEEAIVEAERQRNLFTTDGRQIVNGALDAIDDAYRKLENDVSPKDRLIITKGMFENSDKTPEDYERYIRESAAAIAEIADIKGRDLTYEESLKRVQKPNKGVYDQKFRDALDKLLKGPSPDISAIDKTSKKSNTVNETANEEKSKGSNVRIRGGDTVTRGGDTFNNNTTHVHANPSSPLDKQTPF